jgi:adenylate cyclase
MKPGLDRALMTGLVRARENGPLVASLVIDSRTQAARTIHTPFLAVLREERLGITLFGRDLDGMTRRYSLAMPTEDGAFPTLVGRLCRALQKKCADGLIDFALGEPFRYVPLHDVLKSGDPEYLSRLFRDRIVLFGEAARYSDRVSVPVNLAGWETKKHDSPGVVVHAAALRTALHGKPAEEAGKPLMLLLVSAAALLVLMRDWRLALVTGLVTTALLLALATSSLHAGLSIHVAPALLTLTLAWAARTAHDAWSGRRDRERLRAAFGGYVSPPVLRAILKGEIRPGRLGEKRELAFVFADLRGSTAMTARTSPEEAMALLNRFHQVISTSIHRHDGMLDNIRGDGVMAVFGAPKVLPEPVKAAFAALQDMFKGLDRLNAELEREGKPPLAMVAGMAYGEAVVGHVGARDRFNYTAVGDAANVAARLQDSAKRKGVRAMVAGSARDKLPDADLEPLGPLEMEGHDPVEGWGWR